MVVISDQSAGKKYLLNFYFDSKLPSNLFEILLLALFGFISTFRAYYRMTFRNGARQGGNVAVYFKSDVYDVRKTWCGWC